MSINFKCASRCRKATIGLVLVMSWHMASPAHAAPNEPTLADEMRVKSIGYRLASANQHRCATPRMMTGLHLHDETGYDQSIRHQVRAFYGIGGGFGVLDIVSDSAASRTGLQARDEIVEVDGINVEAIALRKRGKKASYGRTEAFVRYLEQRLEKGETVLTIRRGTSTIPISISGEPGCGGEFTIMAGSTPNARADGKYVGVSQGMLEMANDDSELAFVIGHEMGHNLMNHPGKLGKFATLFAELGIGTAEVRKSEIDADQLGVKIMSSAGFDLEASERILRKIGKYMPLNLSLSHPGFGRRIAAVNQARLTLAEEAAQQIAVNSSHVSESMKPAVGTAKAMPFRSTDLGALHSKSQDAVGTWQANSPADRSLLAGDSSVSGWLGHNRIDTSKYAFGHALRLEYGRPFNR